MYRLFLTALGLSSQPIPQEIKKDTSDLPYQLKEVVFTEKEKKRLNINDRETYYRITKNGKVVNNAIFRQGAFSSDIIDLNTKRYVELLTYDEERYSDYVIKECKLKSPYCLKSHNCVFDMETHEIVFKTKDFMKDYIFIYDNLCVNNIRDGIWFLPERRWILGDSKLEKYIETDKYIFAHTNKYDSGKVVVYRVDRITGEVINCNEI